MRVLERWRLVAEHRHVDLDQAIQAHENAQNGLIVKQLNKASKLIIIDLLKLN